MLFGGKGRIGPERRPEGKGYVRVNIATPRRNVRRALEMLSGAIRAL